MTWILIALVYLIVGFVLFAVFWRAFNIQWEAEAMDMQIMMVATPVLWPLVLLFMLAVWFGVFGK